MNKHPHVVVFDSGAGGLSIARTILHTAQTSIRISYFADMNAFPYGNKDEAFLITHICKLIGELIHQHQPDAIIIACNTASTLVLPALRLRFSCPFIGVVPAIKPAAKLSVSKCIGVLATPATVKREYTAALINEFAPDCRVALHGSDKLVRCAENFISSCALDVMTVQEELNILLSQFDEIDTVVLACTHFPLIKDALKSAAPGVLHWVDSSEAIARRVFHLLRGNFSGLGKAPTKHEIEIYFGTDVGEDNKDESLRKHYKAYLGARQSV